MSLPLMATVSGLEVVTTIVRRMVASGASESLWKSAWILWECGLSLADAVGHPRCGQWCMSAECTGGMLVTLGTVSGGG